MSIHDAALRSETPVSPKCASRTLRQHLLLRLCRHIARGRMTIVFPNGSQHTHESGKKGPDAVLRIHRDRAITRLALGGDIGLAESFMDGDWDSPDLVELLKFGAANLDTLDSTLAASAIRDIWNRIQHTLRANTRKGSRRNISFHYDLGNQFYAQWLDKSMSYSAALFEAADQSFENAQGAKYRRLAEAVDLSNGDNVLEIGCGWGGFAETAARDYGSKLVGVTLSAEQQKFARKRLAASDLQSQTDIRLQDYRDVTGTFDAIVSIEMFEAVGEENWRAYFEKVRSLLRPGGKAGIQVITIDHARFDTYRKRPDFIQKYIFPGGMLPSPERFEEEAAAAGLQVNDRLFFGNSYAETLRRWDEQFQARWSEIEPLGFDERFRRLWTYYLGYCEAGFRTGAIDVAQYTLTRP